MRISAIAAVAAFLHACTGAAACRLSEVRQGVVYGDPASGCCHFRDASVGICDPMDELRDSSPSRLLAGKPASEVASEARAYCMALANGTTGASVQLRSMRYGDQAKGEYWRNCEQECERRWGCAVWTLEPLRLLPAAADGTQRIAAPTCWLVPRQLSCTPTTCNVPGLDGSHSAFTGMRDCSVEHLDGAVGGTTVSAEHVLWAAQTTSLLPKCDAKVHSHDLLSLLPQRSTYYPAQALSPQGPAARQRAAHN